jgi:hypothetical protein
MRKVSLTIIAVVAMAFSISSCSSKSAEGQASDSTTVVEGDSILVGDSSAVVTDSSVVASDTTKK